MALVLVKTLILSRITRDITNELHLLRSSQSPGLSDAKSDVPQALVAQDSFTEHLAIEAPFLISSNVDDCAVFTLGTVSVPSPSIVDLFQQFVTSKHPW